MKTLKIKYKGEDVKILQRYLDLTPDGYFGKKTESKVKEFQLSKGLKDDGVVGKSTWLELIKPDLSANKINDGIMIKYAIELNVDLAMIKAIKEVESGGKGIQNGIPTMLFEGHVFWRQLESKGINPNNYIKGNENILYKNWTKKYYTGKNQLEYQRLLKAAQINEMAAYESASYGLFQLMGTNYKTCGYANAKEFFNDLSKNEVNHLKSFIEFIKSKGIVKYMKEKNWKKIAYLYNGAGYAKNKYDEKLRLAYIKYS